MRARRVMDASAHPAGRVEARAVARLMTGDLTAGYREAMAGLAADDAVRYLVEVPGR